MAQTIASTVRYPRGKITANGKELRFATFEVIQNAHHAADTFDVQMALFDPDAPFDWVWWSDQVDIEIEVSVGFADDSGRVAQWTSLIVGPVDAISEAPLAYGPYSQLGTRARTEVGRGGMLPTETGPKHPTGALLQIQGRDYSGQLIDSGVDTEVLNGTVTSKDVVDKIASQVPQLSVSIDDPGDAVGDAAFFGDNILQGRLLLNRSAWDVVTAVADHEGMQAQVKGKTLKLKKPGAQDTGSPFELFYIPEQIPKDGSEVKPVSSNMMTLRMTRALNVGKGIDHFVQGYDQRVGRRPSRAVARARSAERPSKGNPVTRTENIPGMTQEQAEKHAKSRAEQSAKFERYLEFQIPGDPALTIESGVRLSGTGTKFDQSYEMHQLTHFFSVTEGYRMEGRARNKSADVAVTTQNRQRAQPGETGAAPAAATPGALPEVPSGIL